MRWTTSKEVVEVGLQTRRFVHIGLQVGRFVEAYDILTTMVDYVHDVIKCAGLI